MFKKEFESFEAQIPVFVAIWDAFTPVNAYAAGEPTYDELRNILHRFGYDGSNATHMLRSYRRAAQLLFSGQRIVIRASDTDEDQIAKTYIKCLAARALGQIGPVIVQAYEEEELEIQAAIAYAAKEEYTPMRTPQPAPYEDSPEDRKADFTELVPSLVKEGYITRDTLKEVKDELRAIAEAELDKQKK